MTRADRTRFFAERQTIDAQQLFRILVALPKRDFAKFNAIANGLTALLPKQPRALGTALMKDTWSISEPRLLVITGHLYLDYVLTLLLYRKGVRIRRDDKFSTKLRCAERQGLLSADVVASFSSVNRLRNNFAHELFFNIGAWDPFEIPYMKKHTWNIPRQRKLRAGFNLAVLRVTFFALLIELTEAHRWIHLEDVPSRSKRKVVVGSGEST